MKDKVILITGAGKRVGACTAKTLHEQGARIIIHYNSSAKAAEKLKGELNAIRKNSAVILQADLNDMEDLKTLAEAAINTWGRMDALVNNASSFFPTKIGKVTEKDWNNLFNTNAKAPFFLAQALSGELKKTKGAIINMVDIHAERPLKNFSIYCMAKAALVAMTKALARDLAPDIRVNGIAPGMILWPEGEGEMTDKMKQSVVDRIPLQEPGDPQYAADSILFLLQQKYITGQILAVDGGRSLNV